MTAIVETKVGARRVKTSALVCLLLGVIIGATACRPQPARPTNPPPGVVPPGAFVHYLRANERLDDVARRYRRTPETIIAANRLKPYDMVYEGFPLRIPPPAFSSYPA